jgi:RES domain-containing protein
VAVRVLGDGGHARVTSADAPRLPLVGWDSSLYCHAPADRPFDPAALDDEGDGADRWCQPGQPTAYLAGDAGVAIAELARHHPPGGTAVERRIMRLEPKPRGIRGLVDLRDQAVLRALDAPIEAPRYLDTELARSVAERVREDERHLGLIVPSMAFLDHPERPNIVIFADRHADGAMGSLLADWREIARIAVGGP